MPQTAELAYVIGVHAVSPSNRCIPCDEAC